MLIRLIPFLEACMNNKKILVISPYICYVNYLQQIYLHTITNRKVQRQKPNKSDSSLIIFLSYIIYL